jgi:hypothetical protein
MQLFKQMEVVLMLACGIVFASAAFGPARSGATVQRAQSVALDAGPALAVHTGMAPPMPMVHIVGRRLSADEKHASVASIN